ncbi:MAG: hypothetical protein ACQEXJ_06550 [Myxococcota bacterium]
MRYRLLATSTRRGFLGRLLLGAAAALPLLGRGRTARAGIGPGRLRSVDRGRDGTTLYLDLDHGPFPCRDAPYQDATTVVFVPRHFRPRDGLVDLVVHFHGHRTTAPEAMRHHRLREQLVDSLQNAILVIPQGPVRAVDSGGGKLERPKGFLYFLAEVRRTLQTDEVVEILGEGAPRPRARVGLVCLSVHSGGYKVAARCLDVGGYPVREVYLFDALYGELETFVDWIGARRHARSSRRRHKLVSFYAEETVVRLHRDLIRLLREARLRFVRETPGDRIGRGQLVRSRVALLERDLEHEEVPWRENALRDCLLASCLSRRLASDWFAHRAAPRPIDRRQ